MFTHRTSRCIKIIFYSLLLIPTFGLCLPEGVLDRSYNPAATPGLVRSLADAHYNAIAIQADGKAVVAGYAVVDNRSCWTVARYHTDGTIDTSFGTHGHVLTRFAQYETESQAQAIALQMDGKIVVGGFTNAVRGKRKWCLARYNSDGSADANFFGCNALIFGTVINCFDSTYEMSMVNDIAIQPDGKIIAVGMRSTDDAGTMCTVARYMNNGSLDTDFNARGVHGIPGMITTYFGNESLPKDEAKAVALDTQGRIVVAGSSMQAGVRTCVLARYTADGCLDESLVGDGQSTKGALTTSLHAGENDACAHDIAIQLDGKIVVAGYSNSNNQKSGTRFTLIRYNQNGSLDRSFGGYGFASVPGTVMSGFGLEAKEARAHALVVQRDGKLVVGGAVRMQNETCFGLARYNTDGTVDCTFNNHGTPVGSIITNVQSKATDEIFGLAIQEDGCIVAAGKTQSTSRSHAALARYAVNDMPLMVPCVTTSPAASIFDTSIKIMGKAQNPALVEIFINDKLQQRFTCLQTNNVWQYTLADIVDGSYTVKVLAMYYNGNVCLASEPVTFTVSRRPRGVQNSNVTYNNEKVSGTLLAEGGSGSYEFSIISCTNGHVELDKTVYTFTPSIEEGQGIITFKIVDTHTRFEGIGTIPINILAIPRFTVDSMPGYVGKRVDGYLIDFIHGGYRNFTFKYIGAEHGTAFINKDSYFRFTPDKDFAGVAKFEFEFTDDNRHTSTVSIPIYIYPELKAGSVQMEGGRNGTIKGQLVHAARGGATPYTFALVPDSAVNGTATIEPNGDFQFEPMRDYEGKGSFAYTMADKYGTVSNQARVTITIHQSPEAAHDQWAFYINEEFKDCLKNKVVKGKEPYTFCIVKGAKHGNLQLEDNGMVTFVPHEGFAGKDSFEYVVIDARNGKSNHACITMNIASQLCAGKSTITIYENALLRGNLCTVVRGGIAPYSFVNCSSGSGITINKDGAFMVQPDHALCGENQCMYEVRDSYKAQAQGSIAMSVLPIPHAKAAQFETLEAKELEGSLLCLAEGGVAPYIFEKVDDRTTRTNTVVHEDGTFSFYPAQKTTGKSSFTYRFIDSNGYMSNPATIDIMVHALPQVADTQFKTYINTPVKGILSDRVVMGSAPYSFSLVGSPCNGVVTLNERGIFTFYPDKDFTGTGSFQYQIEDSHKGVSSVATVIITIYDIMVTQPVALFTKENMPLQFDLTRLVSGGEPPYRFALKQKYAGLQIKEDGSLTYTPAAGFQEKLTCEYQVVDMHNNISTNQIVIAVKEKPYSLAYTFEIMQSQPLTDTLQVLVDGIPPYTFELLKQVTDGTLMMQKDGSFTFTPTPDFSGDCSFCYRVYDAYGDVSNPACITIHIAPFLPLKDDTYTTFVDTPLSSILKKPAHKDAAGCTFECIESPSYGTVNLKPDGAFTFIPNKDFSGIAQFKFRIMNKDVAMSDSATVRIMVVEMPSRLPIIPQQELQQAYQFLNSFLKL